MSGETARVDRKAHRRRDPAVLARILVGQLTAQRCSTVYAPSTTKLDKFMKDAVLPRLHEQLDARVVIVERWEKKQGPTVQQLVDAIYAQLEMTPDLLVEGEAPQKPIARLEAALERAERRSDRPLLLVMYRLEELLDEKRDHREVSRFVEALARMAALPMHGLHLVLGVKEEDLGAFRDLLRGRWRLLANDIRIRPIGKAWLLSLPLVFFGYMSAKAGAVVVAVAAVSVGVGAVGGVVVSQQWAPPQECVCPDPAPASAATPRGATARAPTPDVEDPTMGTTGDTPTATTAATTAATTDRMTTNASTTNASTTDASTTDASTTDASTTDGMTTDALLDPAPTPTAVDMCLPGARDGECAKCVRSKCCAELKACKRSKWRNCVLAGKTGQGECRPELIETNCRGLALCGLEYQCRVECFP